VIKVASQRVAIVGGGFGGLSAARSLARVAVNLGRGHIYFLIGFRSRIVVMLDWLWAYLTCARGSAHARGDPRRVDPQQSGQPTAH